MTAFATDAVDAADASIRLTQYSHGGGCGCKIAPALLAEMLADTPIRALAPELLVGAESGDDAAVYRLNDTQAIVATTDFFTPIVDDPHDFGRIAATNAISDVYAMGAQPIFALAVVGMPLEKLPVSVIRQILAGGESVCTAAGIPLAGGHSIDTLEPIYGLVALGLVHPERLKRNNLAQAGDVLVLGKPLGVGVLSAALKKGLLSKAGYEQMLRTTTQLNTAGHLLAAIDGVHALTDVTGFGLAGHLLELCRGAQLAAQVEFAALPLLEEARTHAQAGLATGASGRNWASYGDEVVLPDGFAAWQQALLTDPQTSGGLLAACAPEVVDEVLECFAQTGFTEARVIGSLAQGAPRITVR